MMLRAIENMKRAVACGRNRVQVQNHFGELYLGMGRLAEAEAAFKKAIELDPLWAYSYVNQAMIALQMTQDYLKAANLLKKAIEVDPNCIPAYLQLSQLHMLLQEWDDKKETLDKALKVARTDTDLKSVCSM